MNYKQINENWQTYQLVEYLLEDRSYVTGVLGIELPLNESGQVSLTQELKEQIIITLVASIGEGNETDLVQVIASRFT